METGETGERWMWMWMDSIETARSELPGWISGIYKGTVTG